MEFTKIIKVFTFVIIVIINIVENSNAISCLKQLRDSGIVQLNTTGREAFRKAFLEVYYPNAWTYSGDILRLYLEYVYNQFAMVFSDNMCESPMNWCKNKNLLELTHTPIDNYDDNTAKCEDYLVEAGFSHYCNARTALRYAYFELNVNYVNDVAKAYLNYMVDAILSHIVEIDVEEPKLYCKNIYPNVGRAKYYSDYYDGISKVRRMKYCYKDCMNEIAISRGMNVNSSAKEAFIYAYNNLSSSNTLARIDGILREYYNDLFAEVSLCHEVLRKPLNWCMENIPTILPNIEPTRHEEECRAAFRQVDFNIDKDAKFILKKCFFQLTSEDERLLNNILAKAYYEYIIESISIMIDPSRPFSPHQYCFEKSIGITSTIGQSSTTVLPEFNIDLNQAGDNLNNDPHAMYYTQFSNTYVGSQTSAIGPNTPFYNFFQTGSSSTQIPHQDIYVNPPPSSSAGENIALQTPALSSSTNDTNFTPSMFFATPDQDGCYGPMVGESSYPVDISSDENS